MESGAPLIRRSRAMILEARGGRFFHKQPVFRQQADVVDADAVAEEDENIEGERSRFSIQPVFKSQAGDLGEVHGVAGVFRDLQTWSSLRPGVRYE